MIIALPLFWLKLMQWAFLDDTAIIAEGISMVGAILGGTISGALTLIGVRITIKRTTEQVDKTIRDQQHLRDEELINSAIKEQLVRLYHPLNSMISLYIFKYGAHDFDMLSFEEQIKFISHITDNEIYAEKELFSKILEIKWAYKDGDYELANQFYSDISSLITDTISIMKNKLKLPNQEI